MKRIAAMVFAGTVCILLVCHPIVRAGFNFIRPETPLVEPSFYGFSQAHVHPNFDALGNVHYIFEDDRAGVSQFWGTTIMSDGVPLPSYLGYSGFGTDDLYSPFILRSIAFFNNMFLVGYNSVTQDVAVVQYDLTGLPGTVNPVMIAMKPVDAPPIDAFQAASVLDHLVFCYERFPELRFGGFQIGGGWDIESTIGASGSDYLQHVDIAVDEENFIYICYDRWNSNLLQYELTVRRSVNAGDFSGGFHPAHTIATHDSGPYFPELAVTGSNMMMDLAVSVLYILPDPGFTSIECITELDGNWTVADFNPLGAPSVVNDDQSSTVSIVDSAFDAAYDHLTRRLHVVWSDDRMQPTSFLYGDTSYNYGLSFGLDKELGAGVPDIVEAPRLALGMEAGHMSVSYTRFDGMNIFPNALVSSPEFYDTCDTDPAIYWDGASGVNIDPTQFHGFDGASYAMVAGDTRGVLIRDYGSMGQQGVIDLFFYDNMNMDPDTEFLITVNNANAKNTDGSRGVIRMLGVKNDINPTNCYKYSEDGITWQTFGTDTLRSMGWHNVIITLTPGGTSFDLEGSPGNYTTVFDSEFTSFTSLEIQGDDVTPPFNVDDVQVEVFPIGGPMPIPALSVIGLLILMISMAIVLRRQ